jgi:HEAT repeat protein
LKDAIEDKSPDVRVAVVKALREIGPEAADTVPVLLRLAQQEQSNHVWSELDKTIHVLGKFAVPLLQREVTKERTPLRESAIMYLGDLGASAREAVATLEPLLKDESIAFLVAKTLLRIDPVNKKATTALFRFIEDNSDDNEGLRAAKLLIQTPERRRLVPYLTSLLERPSATPDTVVGTSELLWHLGRDAEKAVPALSKWMREFDSQTNHFYVVYVAGTILKVDPKNEAARKVLRKWAPELLEVFSSDLHLPFALELLRLLGPEAKPAAQQLRKLLDHPDAGIRRAAAEVLLAIQ